MIKPTSPYLRLFAAVDAFVADDIRRQRRKWPRRTKDQMIIMSLSLCRTAVSDELSRLAVEKLSPRCQRSLTQMP